MRVLVTRPEPGASETAARLRALGHEPVLLALTEIQRLAAEQLADIGIVDAVAVTSANAVRHPPKALIAALSQKPCFAVGGRTAEAARKAGFSDVTSTDGDAAALAGVIIRKLRTRARMAYLCGRVRRPEFEAALSSHGIDAVAIETYDTMRRDWPSKAAVEALGGSPVDLALVYSMIGAEALLELALRPEVAHLFARTRYCCLSPRIAETFGPAAASRIMVSPEPTEAALISLIGMGQAAKSFS